MKVQTASDWQSCGRTCLSAREKRPQSSTQRPQRERIAGQPWRRSRPFRGKRASARDLLKVSIAPKGDAPAKSNGALRRICSSDRPWTRDSRLAAPPQRSGPEGPFPRTAQRYEAKTATAILGHDGGHEEECMDCEDRLPPVTQERITQRPQRTQGKCKKDLLSIAGFRRQPKDRLAQQKLRARTRNPSIRSL